jgi:HAD superfamily hydrolase (TIGR01509 family)
VSGARPANARGLVIFDCDGVLVDSMGIDMRELTRAIAAVGGTLTRADVQRAFHGRSLADIERGVAEHLGGAPSDGWIERYLTTRAAAFADELRPIPGAAEAIAGVRAAGWEACIASGGRMAKMEQTLSLTGLRDAFADDRIFSAYAPTVARSKPAPDLFLHAAGTCGYAPANCVVVEDSLPGIAAGRAPAMRTLGYTGDDASLEPRFAALGAEPLADLRELPARLAA